MRKKVKLCCCFISLFDSDEDTGQELKILPKFADTNNENSKGYLQKQSINKKFDFNTQSKIINENNNSVKDMDNLQLLKNIEKDHKLYKFWYEEEIKNNKDLKIEINPLSPIITTFNISNKKIQPLPPEFNISNEEIPSLSPLSQISNEEISQILEVPKNSPQESLSNSIDKITNSLTINISPNFSYLPT